MREYYTKQLQQIHDNLLRMGSRVEHAAADALRALARWDTDLAQRVIAEDHEIDSLRAAIEESILEVIARQQPVATDLRRLLGTIAISTELERMGDYAKGIAKRVTRNMRAPVLVEAPPELHRMGEAAQHMLHTSLDAFVRLDADLARSLVAEDEKVDELQDRAVATLLDQARADPNKLDGVYSLLDIAHVLERMADRTTNIAERVIFIATSATEELNP
ncbi:MAG: phosphate signaling complex protein PhoU [Chloroflexota bacterium]|nr:MAG: phosphate transport system regulatory protein PhoU [Chloroflexota bacterium]